MYINFSSQPITLQGVKDRILSLGFVVTAQDDTFLEFQIRKTVKYALAQINHASLPIGLYEAVTDMVVGEFLLIQQSLGKLDNGNGAGSGGGLGGGSVAEIRDGDTTVKYATNADTAKGSGKVATGFQGLLDQLLQPDYDWGQWRKLKWC